MPEWWETALKILSGVTPFVVAIGGIVLYVAQFRWSKKFERTRNELRGTVVRDNGIWVQGTLRPW